jgi:serine/threonine-protein kinase
VTRYELLDRIGVGGMAEIFRGKAVAAGGFEKPVAIKRILAHLSQDTRFVELLIAEAKILSLLKHRNIVQIFDVGLGDDGKYFLVMEYVDGKDLGAIQRGLEARRRRLPFDLALHIGAELCEALEHAHSAKAPDGKPMSLVHRDISPSNVLLSRAGEIKLTDFGIAKRAESEATKSGAVRGKFAYIAPEQARNEHVEPRSDVFAVGILLWELVTNKRLFSGLGDLEALRAVREGKIQRPIDVDPNIDPQADALIMRALSRDLSKRPTAGELGQKLRSLRYSLDVTVGDPATELAKIIDTADEVERQSAHRIPMGGFEDGAENTVIRIRTADAFVSADKGIAQARQVIDHFEEEQTRLASISGDQLKFLRATAPRDSGELTAATPPPRSRRETEEPTIARSPLDMGPPPSKRSTAPPPHQSIDSDEHTRMIAPRGRTPVPERIRAPSVAPPPPPQVSRQRPPTPPPLPQRGTEMISAPMRSMPTPYPPPQRVSQQPIQPMPQPPPQQIMTPPGPYQAPPHMMTPYPQQQQQWQPPPPPPQHRPPQQTQRGPIVQPWMLIVGALIMAGLAFGVTRACIGSSPKAPAADK